MNQIQELKKGDVVLFIFQMNGVEVEDLANQHTLCAGIVSTLGQPISVNIGCGIGLLVDRKRVFSSVQEAVAAIAAMEQKRTERAEGLAKQAKESADAWLRRLEAFD